MSKIDYKGFIEDNFFILNKHGVLVPFIFNDVQNLKYQGLIAHYGEELQGIRENDLKGRQFGFSSLITALFTTDFILSELGEIPVTNSDIYSHKDDETAAHLNRFNLFLDSYLMQDQGATIEDMGNTEAREAFRKQFLAVDNGGHIKSKHRGAEYHTQTASAKVSGRGGTKQNIHWSEVAFYPNTEIMNAKTLVTGAEKQVAAGFGKIFRETTGNTMVDFFAKEYQEGKEGKSLFRSNFTAWYLHKAYTLQAPSRWELPSYYERLISDGLATTDQCYWHWMTTKQLTDKYELREYPTYDTEAFILGGDPYFDEDALMHYVNAVRKPIREVEYATAL